MQSNQIRLHLNKVSEIPSNENIGLIMLTDEDDRHVLSIVCERHIAIALELRKQKSPIAELLLPEVMGRILKEKGSGNFELIIGDIMNEQYQAFLFDTDALKTYPIRVSDGILLSVVMRFPIFIDREVMRQQSTPFNAKSHGVSLPINVLSIDMLEKSLNDAINNEEYEIASRLRDEIARRQHTENRNEQK